MRTNRQILVSLIVIGLVAALAGGTTLAFFNDTESSQNNTFAAGSIDLKIDWNETYNGEVVETQPFTDNPGPIFELNDIKPGDSGEATISLHVFDNPAFLWMAVNQTSNQENGCTEPEIEAEPECPADDEGELGEHLNFHIWYDDGDNVFEDGEQTIFEGTPEELETTALSDGMRLDADPSTESIEAFDNSTTRFIGFEWSLPAETGNEVQTDSKTFDIEFVAEQARHNDGEPQEPQEPQEEDLYYQADLVGGSEVIEDLSVSTYSGEDRLQRFVHGAPGIPKGNETELDQVKTASGGPDCVDSDPFVVDTAADTISIDFTVHNETECDPLNMTLVSYAKPHPGFIPSEADEQVVFDSSTHSFSPGDNSLTVDIPNIN